MTSLYWTKPQFATNFCTWHDSSAVVSCANIYSDQCIEMSKTKSPSNMNCDGNPLMKLRPVLEIPDKITRDVTPLRELKATTRIQYIKLGFVDRSRSTLDDLRGRHKETPMYHCSPHNTAQCWGRMGTLVAYPNVNNRWARIWTCQANIVILNSPRIQVYICVTWIPSHVIEWTGPSFKMTSSNGNIFRVTGHLCGEFTGPRWIPRTKASDAELWCLLWCAPE